VEFTNLLFDQFVRVYVRKKLAVRIGTLQRIKNIEAQAGIFQFVVVPLEESEGLRKRECCEVRQFSKSPHDEGGHTSITFFGGCKIPPGTIVRGLLDVSKEDPTRIFTPHSIHRPIGVTDFWDHEPKFVRIAVGVVYYVIVLTRFNPLLEGVPA
jgi:hypothetical protein